MDCVKFTPRGAESAPNAAVFIHRGCTAAKTSSGFRANLLFGKRFPEIMEGSLRISRLMPGYLTGCMVVGRNLNVVLVQLLEFAKIASDRQRLSFMNKAVH